MANPNLIKILDLYKAGKINADEAEKMISSIRIDPASHKDEIPCVPWEDDGRLRVVAYIGKKLLKKGDARARHIEVKYDGEALDVESYGNLTCGNIGRNASAGGGITCGNIGGNASAGGGITCGDIGGHASCGGGLRCKSINGKIKAGGSVHIGK